MMHRLRALPRATLRAATEDRTLRFLWLQIAVVAAICLLAEPAIHWITHR